MKLKFILSFFALLASVLLAGVALLTLPSLFNTLKNTFSLITGNGENVEADKVIGWLIYWFTHISMVVVLWVYGRKWLKESRT
tara:strand:- start:870 stop:1118 length:249 start_codon:yes stop_codon:yes gene_type:complete